MKRDDVLGSLAGERKRLLDAELTPPEYVRRETERLTGDQWNERAVAHWRDTSRDSVRAEFERNADLLAERVAQLSDDDVLATDRVPWPGEDRPLWRFIGHDTFLVEWPAHAAQIEQAASA